MAPLRLTSIVRSQSSSVVSKTPLATMTPALFTRMSIRPKCSIGGRDEVPGVATLRHVRADGDRVAAAALIAATTASASDAPET